MGRRPNFIDRLANDKKGHLILGLFINPFIFVLWHERTFLALLTCLFIHGAIEFLQWFKKTGKAEFYDFLAGSYSAIIIYILILIIK